MTTTKFDKELKALDREQQQAHERFDGEASEIREQSRAAQEAAEQARRKIAELEAKRPALALGVVSEEAGAEEALVGLDEEADGHRRHLELAELAEGEAGKKEQEIAERRRASGLEFGQRRYDLYAEERRGLVGKVEAAVGELSGSLAALLDLDAKQMSVLRFEMGTEPAGRLYSEIVADYLAFRLGRYVSDRALRSLAFGTKPVDSLLEVDLHLGSTEEQRAANEAQARRVEEMAAARERAGEAYFRRQDFEDRRQQMRVRLGYNAEGTDVARIRAEIDATVDAALAREGFTDLIEAERRDKLEARRSEIAQMLISWVDHEPSEEERAQIEARTNEQLAEEFPDLAGEVAG